MNDLVFPLLINAIIFISGILCGITLGRVNLRRVKQKTHLPHQNPTIIKGGYYEFKRK